ncbi:DoxX family protein [Paracoccus aminophilus]|uniref:DoxX family protein n=1 Tax=Paracoccus aminophilus JCM 7686 TaxID=1367847 RepID=S5Y8M6_PARAH|nr:DoxX family protein [Paracoccus aminophilus]AGT07688.1 DoxX family protein [Paracoccus aminophilus JCM 7686]
MDLTFFTPYMLSLLRIMVGLLFLSHGTAKVLGFPKWDERPAVLSIYWVAGLFELVLGTFLTIGLFSRQAAFVASGVAAFAYFIGHARKSFYPFLNGGEAAVLFCFVFLYLVFSGPGPISVDALIGLFSSSTTQ